MEQRLKPGEIPKFKGEILLCEDNEINQHVIKTHLVRLGFSVVLAADGRQGVNSVQERQERGEKPFDLIFMDIQMPVMDGLEAAGLIAGLGVNTPLVALTANVTQEDNDIYAAHGMPRSLCKPFTETELWACLYEYFTPVSREQIAQEERAAEEEKQRVKLFSSFVRRNQNTFGEICRALETGDVKLAHRHAHTLRGLAGLMGKKELQESARIVENALAGGSADNLSKDALETMGKELKSVLDELAPYLQEPGQQPQANWDKNTVRELLERLEPLLLGDNAQSQQFADALRPVPGAGTLITQLEDYEFEAALDALAGLRKALEL